MHRQHEMLCRSLTFSCIKGFNILVGLLIIEMNLELWSHICKHVDKRKSNEIFKEHSTLCTSFHVAKKPTCNFKWEKYSFIDEGIVSSMQLFLVSAYLIYI